MRAWICWILLGMTLVACGDSSTDSGSMSPGLVYVDNSLSSNITLVFSYFNEEHGEAIEVSIPRGETKNISKHELPGGSMVTFSWRTGGVHKGKLTVTIDGTVTIRVTGLRPPSSDPLIYDITVG